MAKAAPPYIKYIIHANIYVDGIVEKPDVVGALFGQTEGLLGPDLDLRELQRSAKIGRIEVNLKVENNKTFGEIIIPTSLNRFESSLVAAALETVTRVGPANATIKVTKIEDARRAKIQYILERSRELLNKLVLEELPDTKELLLYLEYSQKMKSLIEYGPEKLPAGPAIDSSEEIIIVEGRADVLNLLKYGISNVIALNGLNVPKTIVELSKKKIVTVFVDGDRAGELLVKYLMINGVDIDFVAKADPGKEVEELSRKEIVRCLKNKVSFEQVKSYYEKLEGDVSDLKNIIVEKKKKKDPILEKLKPVMESIFKTDQAILLDDNFNIVNKVSVQRIHEYIGKQNVAYIVMDGILTRELLDKLENTNVKAIVAVDSIVKKHQKINIYTLTDLDKV